MSGLNTFCCSSADLFQVNMDNVLFLQRFFALIETVTIFLFSLSFGLFLLKAQIIYFTFHNFTELLWWQLLWLCISAEWIPSPTSWTCCVLLVIHSAHWFLFCKFMTTISLLCAVGFLLSVCGIILPLLQWCQTLLLLLLFAALPARGQLQVQKCGL